MGRLFVRIASATLMAAALLAPSSAWADARTKARRAFSEGMRLIGEKAYEAGIERLREANAAVPHPNVQFNIAQAYLSLDDKAEAARWFRTYLDQPKPPPDAERIEALVGELEAAAEPPPDAYTKLPPGDAPIRPLPQQTAEDLAKLRALADAMRPLASERAEELARITRRMASAFEATPDGDPDGEPDPVEPPPPPPPEKKAPVDPSSSELRAVEAYQEKEVVVAATRAAAEPQNAPAVVWVITQQQIRQRGYESVAEALRNVAGLHVIDDHVFVDVGVRGLHGGLRGMSRIIKVLVDGHPVTFRPTNGALLGLELIPIRAVDRIELIRGPGSALYGANAFLGVLQIVTRRGGDVGGGAVTGRVGFSTTTERVDGSTAPNVLGSIDAVAGVAEGSLSMLAAAQVSFLDRSGLRIPDTSPFVEELTMLRDGVSVQDKSTPISLFGSLAYDMGKKGQLTLTSGWQQVDANAEWLDYGALTHFSRVRLSNLYARLGYDVNVTDDAALKAFTSVALAGPMDGHKIRPLSGFSLRPNEARHLEEAYKSQAVLSGLELSWDLPDHGIGVRVGTDLDIDVQQLARVSAVTDEEQVGSQVGDTITVATSRVEERTFTNVGLYLQVAAHPLEFMDVIGGLRYDFHSIYASALNGRVGMVLRANDWLYFKALYGSSFRAPAPDQLYRGQAYTGDALGCLDYEPCAAIGLKPQTAHTGEVVAGVRYQDVLNLQLTGFVSFVDDLIISFPNYANAFVTTNAGEYLSTGMELEASARRKNIAEGLDIAAHAFLALQNTRTEIPQSLFDPAESIRAEFREASLFPGASAGGGIDFSYRPGRVGLYLEGRYVGARRASGSNLALSLGLSNYDGDSLPGYFELDANLSTRDLYIFDAGETVLSVRVTDILGIRHAEGGYRGWDIPTPGRLVFFRIIQEY